MTTKIYVAKYVPDVARWEPKNVGVIVTDGRSVEGRFIAETTAGKVDGHKVRYSIGAPTDVYREWVRYWRRRMADGEVPLPDKERSSDFFVVEAGETWFETDSQSSLSDSVSSFYSRLVQPDPGPAEAELRAEVENLIQVVDLEGKVTVERDVDVPGSHVKGAGPVRFAYRFTNGHAVMGQRVPLGIETLVHDALYRYLAAGTDVPIVSFVHGHEGAYAASLALLKAHSRVVDVTDPAASDELDDVLAAG